MSRPASEAGSSAAADMLMVETAIDPLDTVFPSYYRRPSDPGGPLYRDFGVQTVSSTPPHTPPRVISSSANLIDFSPSPPRTPPPRQATPAIVTTPPSRSATPTPSSYSFQTPTKRSAYTQLGHGRPRAKTFFTLPEDDKATIDAVEELQLRSYIGEPPSRLHIPRPLESMDDDQDVLASQSTSLSLALGRRLVSTPSTGDSAIPASITRPRAVSDSLAALAYASFAQEADLLSPDPELGAANTLAHSRSVSLTFSDSGLSASSSLTSLDTDDGAESLHTHRHPVEHLEYTLADSSILEDLLITEKADLSIVSEPSPPKAIPALHGPLSLPYARCPSGAEGIIIEEPANLEKIVWGLQDERGKIERPIAPSPVAPTTPIPVEPSKPPPLQPAIELASEPATNALQAAIQEVVQAMPRFCGVVSSDGLAQRRAADLAPRRRTHSSPALHTPPKLSTSKPLSSTLRPNAPSFHPGLPQMRRVTIDPAILYVSPPEPMQSPVLLPSDIPLLYEQTGPLWTSFEDLNGVPHYQPVIHGYPANPFLISALPALQDFSGISVPYSAENLHLLQRLTMTVNPPQQPVRDGRSELGLGRPSSLPSGVGTPVSATNRKIPHAPPRARARAMTSPSTSLRPMPDLLLRERPLPTVTEEIEIVTTPPTPITPLAPDIPVQIDQNLLQANNIARAAAKAWGLSETRVPTPAPDDSTTADWPASFKRFWNEQQAARARNPSSSDQPESPTRRRVSSTYRQQNRIAPGRPLVPRSVPMKRLMNRRAGSTALPALAEADEDSPLIARRIPSGRRDTPRGKPPSWERAQTNSTGDLALPLSASTPQLTPQTKTDTEAANETDGMVVRLPQTSASHPAGYNPLTSSPSDEDVVVFKGWQAPPKNKGKGKARA